jgi:uncharacterized OB-fold protein
MSAPTLKIAAPEITPEAAPYWDGARAGKLMLMRCEACGEAYHYPRPFCPFCMSRKVKWIEASGKGTIYSFTVLRRPAFAFAPAHVTLAEGPTIASGIVECPFDKISIGQEVEVTFVPSDGGPPVPMFKPAGK